MLAQHAALVSRVDYLTMGGQPVMTISAIAVRAGLTVQGIGVQVARAIAPPDPRIVR